MSGRGAFDAVTLDISHDTVLQPSGVLGVQILMTFGHVLTAPIHHLLLILTASTQIPLPDTLL